MESRVLRAIVASELQSAGFRKTGRFWNRDEIELGWRIILGCSPRSASYYVEVGVALERLGPLAHQNSPDECKIVIDLSGFRLETQSQAVDIRLNDFGAEVIAALDLSDSWLDDSKRQVLIRLVFTRFFAYIDTIRTLAALRVAYRAGELPAAYIQKDARALLVDH